MSDEAQSLVADIVEHEPKVREEIIANLQSDSRKNDEVSTNGDAVSPADSSDLFGGNTNAETATGPTPTPMGSGETFDPSIHEVNADGTPRLTKDGKPRRKRGRKGSGNAGGSRSSVSGDGSTVPPVGTVTVDYNNLATITCNLFFTGTTSFLGKAWEPSQAEVVSIHSSTKRFLEHYQIEDIPPGLALVLAVGVYAIPRLNDDETKRNIRRYARSLGFNVGIPEPTTNQTPGNVSSPVGEPIQHSGAMVAGVGNSGTGGNGTATFNSVGGRM